MASPAAATGLDAKKMQASFEHLQAREAAMREKEEELAKLVRHNVGCQESAAD